MGALDVLHREPEIDEIPVRGDVHGVEIVKKGLSPVPRHLDARHDDVVASKCRDGDEAQIGQLELRRKRGVVLLDGMEDLLVGPDQVHLVDGHDDVPDAQQRRDEAVPLGLSRDAVPGVDQDDREVTRGGAGCHVARVLLVPRRIGDDELAP